MKCQDFKNVMLKANVGQHIAYFSGVHLGSARERNSELDQIAKFVMALYQIGVAFLYQKRGTDGLMYYYVVLRERLTIRKDQQGSFQEADRLRGII